MAKWSDPSGAAVVLSQIARVVQLNARGEVQLHDYSVYDSALSVLESLVSGHPEVPGVEWRKASRHAVIHAIKNGDLNSTAVILSVSAAENRYLRQPMASFVLLSSLSIRYDGRLKSIRFAGSVFTFSHAAPIHFLTPESARGKVHYGPAPVGYAQVRVSVRARCAHSAVEQAIERLDLLRGIWNFTRHFHDWRRSHGMANPVNEIILGPLHTVHRPNGTPIGSYWWEPTYVEPIAPTDVSRDLERMRRAEKLALLRIGRSALGDRLRECFVRYARALDERDMNTSFVRLWSVLEDLTCVREGESHEVLVRRAAVLSENPSYERVALTRLRKWRNRMVHQGDGTGEAELFVYELKWYIETILRFLLSRSRTFKSWDEFRQFLDLPTDLNALSRRAAIASHARRLRASLRQTAV